MTAERDLAVRLEAWLDDAAASAPPDDLLARSLAKVATIRQRPSWLAGNAWPRRDAAAARLGAVALAAAVLLLLAVWIGSLGTGPGPTATPSPSPEVGNSPSPTGPFLPSTLRSTWVGPTRDVVQLNPTVIEALTLSLAQLQFHGGGRTILTSEASWLGGDQLAFTLVQDEAGCRGGDLGTYTFALGESGRAMTIDLVEDPCAARATALAGGWTRAACPNVSSLCLGDLDPGQHFSASFNPFVPRDAYVYAYGRLSYAVPGGWTNGIDGPDGYGLGKLDVPLGTVFLFSTALADSQAPGCPGTPEPGVGPTAEALASWLATLPGVVATTPTAVSVGGLSGSTLDVSIDPAWTRTCPFSDGKPYVAMFTNGNPVDNFDWGLAAGGWMRLFLLDLPDARTMLIDVEAPDRATWDALVADAMPVIDTFEFHP